MFSGGFRAKLNSRSRRRASVFATAVVTLHPFFLSPYPLLTYALYVDEVSCGQKRSFQSVPKGSQEVDLLNRRGAP